VANWPFCVNKFDLIIFETLTRSTIGYRHVNEDELLETRVVMIEPLESIIRLYRD